jgi:DnaJ family protein A protein 2
MKKKIYKGDNSAKCKKCNGTGTIMQQVQMGFIISQNVAPCVDCSGSGYHYKEKDFLNIEKDIDISIPCGIREGNHIVLKGQGDEYPNMDPSDVHFVIVYKPHPVFSISKDDPLDLITTLQINLLEALYGFKRVIKHLNGSYIEFYLPPRTALCNVISGPIERKIVGEGFKFQGEIGNLYVYFEIQLPDPVKTENLRASLETVFQMQDPQCVEGSKKTILLS